MPTAVWRWRGIAKSNSLSATICPSYFGFIIKSLSSTLKIILSIYILNKTRKTRYGLAAVSEKNKTMSARFLQWLAMLIILSAGSNALAADSNQLPEPVVNSAPAPAAALARLGHPLNLELGRGESLAFIWIAPMCMWVGQHEVSNGQYRRYDASHNSTNLFGRDMNQDIQPVVQVSWDAANNYCNWLNRRYGASIPSEYIFRLPSEPEWETYASCGDQRIYPWGDKWPPPNDYNYRGEEGSGLLYALFQREKFIRGHKDRFVITGPITQSGLNTWGLYGVGGNVWEWCQNWFDAEKKTRPIRGGAWNNERENTLQVAHRAAVPPAWANECIGFRVVIGRRLSEH